MPGARRVSDLSRPLRFFPTLHRFARARHSIPRLIVAHPLHDRATGLKRGSLPLLGEQALTIERWKEEATVAKEDRGFASMDPTKQREIASRGGKAAHTKGTAHEWTSDEAREAGRKGGIASHQKRRERQEGQPEVQQPDFGPS